jgi:Ras GTPase-activating-like protein IQGAP2/3
MSSHETRSMRQSKRISVTALYLSMSAKDKDLEISDDLAKGMWKTATMLQQKLRTLSMQPKNISAN